ncbi:MAG: [FeFe] hydrogenase H-cluster radical SAM maturase HydG [Spirochaetaceae bacterium]|jgi:2-iminoacetate synthase|nr:[FeFe] hydrogenase H-cluster radical SAM maturase HydG [Spirochaetaceae bacterium]
MLIQAPERVIYAPQSEKAEDFISHEAILDTLEYADRLKDERAAVDDILAKAREAKGLSHREASVLLACDDPEKVQEIFDLAFDIKQQFYGNRIVLFAPLYLSNYCINGCLYCPYHRGSDIARKKLTQEEIRAETIALQDMGHKRLAVEAGEDSVNNPIEYILESLDTIYSVKHKNGAIRRVNVNIAATTVENYRRLRDAGIGTYILFQETYDKAGYEHLHPTGPKHDYAYHTEAMDRAMQGGIDDVGLGVLFGLEQYRYEFAGLLMHAEHLEAAFGVGPHTISLPRVKPAHGVDPGSFDGGISDELFAKLAACIRIAVPYTGMIISTREGKSVREKLLRLGVSQISGASRTSVGGYVESPEAGPEEDTRQFEVSDTRTLDEVIRWLIDLNYVPSFCTACYRAGRTGDRFMELCKSKQILNCCHPNALMTLKEYLMDYAGPETYRAGEKLIEKELETIPKDKIRDLVRTNLANIQNGQRDFRL